MSTHNKQTQPNLLLNELAGVLAFAGICLGALLLGYQWNSEWWRACGIVLLAASHAMLTRGPRR
jgi:hypothetical protein